ncbi:MAG: Coenzyme F420 hydrogenase/dehydrogenase, beta subunit C-terminal domain [Candidatus Bathyarchaeia archaeon]
MSDLEALVFGRQRRVGEEFGVYKQVHVARSTDERVLQRCQDGGAVTTLLISALQSGAIDSAIVSGFDPKSPWLPKPMVATTVDEVISCAGTRYAYSPNIIAFKEAVDRGYKHIAFVGTPCQVQALRRIQTSSRKKDADTVAFVIGLFCTESFSYDGLMLEKLHQDMGIPLDNITKISIKGRLLVYMKDGSTREVSLTEVKRYIRKGCQRCGDFSSELADISAGGIGLEGWTLTIIRSDKGEETFTDAVWRGLLDVRAGNEFRRPLNLVVRLSKSKRRRAQREQKHNKPSALEG